MKASYMWGWQIGKMGFSALTPDYLTKGELDKREYVNQYLDPSVDKANCGWHGIAYCVCDINGENRTEFVLMFADKNDTPNAARWINVSGDSKACGRIVDFWLYKESYGIKDYMFGLPFDQRQSNEAKVYTKEELIKIAISNLDEYIDNYFEQYEEC